MKLLRVSGYRTHTLLLFITLFFPVFLFPNSPSATVEKIIWPRAIVQNIPAEIEVQLDGPEVFHPDSISIQVNGEPFKVAVIHGKALISPTFRAKTDITITVSGKDFTRTIFPIPLWMSVLPPLLAIIMALIFREVYSALFSGLLVGAVIISFYQGFSFFESLVYGLISIGDVYIIESLFNTGHLSIIVFSMLIGAMVTLISRNGGMKGIVNLLARYANNERSGQFVTWLMGIAIFFDDYANTLVVGNTMRPVTDRLKISREKLSYLVDSTAAPIASIAFVTTWIGAELSYIEDGINTLGLNESAYDVFLNSIQYSFYPLLALAFILIIIYTGRDFGPMRNAEMNARKGIISKLHPETKASVDNIPEGSERWYNALIPVLVLVLVTITGLVTTGLNAGGWDPDAGFATNLSMVIGNSDSYKALLWGSLSGVVVSVLLTVSQRILTLKESMDTLVKGFKTMVTAVLILVLAWAIALITKYMHTADFISALLLEIQLTPYLVPSITFLLAAFVAFSTGSSWGTMAILYPIILPSSWLLASEFGLTEDQSLAIFHNVVSTVLAGSVFGDHCSPISDTTILSSLASSCNHIEHVRTQLPYALSVGMVATFAGTIPSAYGVPFYILLPVNIVILYLLVRLLGKKTRLEKTNN